MYSFESEEKRGALHAMVIAAFAVAAVLFTLSGWEPIPFPLLFQSGSVICFVAAVYLTARFSLRLYRYAIEPNGIVDAGGMEQYDLVVTEITGNKMKVVARIALREIDEVAVVRRDDRVTREMVKRELCRGKQVFRYANTPVLAEECYISVRSEDSVIVIPTDAGMIKILKG